MRRILAIALASSLVMVASGCGEGADVTEAATPDTSASPTTDGTVTPPSDSLEKVRVVGEVVEVGVCVVVRDDNDITWTITGDVAADLVQQERVQVTGIPNLASTGCGGPIVEALGFTVVPPVEQPTDTTNGAGS